ncbi:MAG: hypothetical protein RBS78_02145 [Coriobacteriia bacterium]|nr:hypothetical protein [Coriobacteriia bacterium]
MPDVTSKGGANGRLSDRTIWVIIAVSFIVLSLLVGLAVWAVMSPRTPSASAPSFERYRPGWESAMAKAGVEAEFPTGPVDITQVKAFGERPFAATFSAEELSALMSVYRYETTISGETVSAADAQVSFPGEGIGEMNVVLYARGSRYRAEASAPVSYKNGRITSPGLTTLKVAGFSVGGANREQAGKALMIFLNEYLEVAPGLEVTQARIVADGVEVRGTAPERLAHPEPLSR